jgi:hypothetical protein
MRTTLTLERDVAEGLEKEMRRTGKGLKATILPDINLTPARVQLGLAVTRRARAWWEGLLNS